MNSERITISHRCLPRSYCLSIYLSSTTTRRRLFLVLQLCNILDLPDSFIDLRDPGTIPLNFTRSINLAVSERGINAMRHVGKIGLLDHVMAATIPMRGRMIHGRDAIGTLYEQAQDYDAKGRV